MVWAESLRLSSIAPGFSGLPVEIGVSPGRCPFAGGVSLRQAIHFRQAIPFRGLPHGASRSTGGFGEAFRPLFWMFPFQGFPEIPFS